ncbi:DUF1254 domain-containing protein [Massilia arenae]|uniref:DUF1254 domain-containing protein n=1 Tax=Massilia arenae TaxID=2603288 RepID=A0A5C7FNB3_9BURK|nr:DUF1254 domain-containing protein [Massilia arenae]TXF96043.1 DUF1254 domain-containing protein [Massilia arenae]
MNKPVNPELTRAQPVAVTVDNFTRAETDMYFASTIKLAGGIGRFDHRRELMPIEAQSVVRANRDTLYSAAVIDLDAGPATVTLPDAGGRFMSLMALDEDQYAFGVWYGACTVTFSREQVGTRYMMVAVRTLVDPTAPGDFERAHALQDRIAIEQGRAGHFEVPEWDAATQGRVRDALAALGASLPDWRRTFGTREQVDPVRHLVGTAVGWGGNPERHAIYLGATPARNDGRTVHRLRLGEVPVDGFWSISVYNARGYFEPNARDAYTVNGYTARRDMDGTVLVQFGGCGNGDDHASAVNCLPVMPGWNYTVRLYRPRAELVSGEWTFPAAEPVD